MSVTISSENLAALNANPGVADLTGINDTGALTFTMKNAAKGEKDSLTLNIESTALKTDTAEKDAKFGITSINADDIETIVLNVNQTNTNGVVTDIASADKMMNLTVKGNANLDLTVSEISGDADDEDGVSIDASELSGDLNLVLNGVNAANITSIKGGSGADDTLDFGAVAATVDSKVSGFENIAVTAANGGELDLSNMEGVTKVALTGANAAAFAVSGLADGQEVLVQDGSFDAANVLSLSASSKKGAVTMHISSDDNFTGIVNVAKGASLTIDSTDNDDEGVVVVAQTIADLQEGTPGSVTSVTLKGDTDLTVTDSSFTKAAKIDASAFTGKLAYTVGNENTVGQTITLGKFAAASALTLENGAGAGGHTADTVVMTAKGGTITITNFEAGTSLTHDKLDLSAYGIKNASALTITDTGADVTIDNDAFGTITLAGIAAVSDLTDGNFVFA